MTTVATAAAAWVLLTGHGFLVARLVLLVRLMLARIEIQFAWSGLPGYLERKYRDSSEEVQRRLALTFRVHQALKMVFLISIAVSALGFVVVRGFSGAR